MQLGTRLLLGFLIALLSVSVQARGRPMAFMDTQLYLGLDLNYGMFDVSSSTLSNNSGQHVDDNQPGVGLVAGMPLGETFGIELGYNNFKKVRVGTQEIGTHHYFGEIQANMPVNHAMRLIGSVGIGRLSAKHGLRFGAGVDYALNDNLHARLQAHYQNLSHGGDLANATIVGLGIVYHFTYF